jgi:hypothetical protein
VHPLTWASIFNIASVLKPLLSRTSCIDDIPRSEYGIYEYPLFAASRYGSLRTVQMLIKAGASVNHPSPNYTPALCGATLARSYEKIRFLLDQGADVNAEDKDNRTALIAATGIGFLDGVQMLLNAGASTNSIGERGTALRVAVRLEHVDIVKLLLESGADPNLECQPTKAPLRDIWGGRLPKRQHYEILKLLLNGGLKVGIGDWRYIYEELIEDIRQLEDENQWKEAKYFLESFEALPQWQAVEKAVLSN